MYLIEFLNGGLLSLSWWQIILAALLLTHITIASVTIFLHRSQAHRALDLHPIPSHFFRLWLWLTTGMQTAQWVSIHRKHHAKCETPEDPHSPQTRGLKKVLLEGAELYIEEAKNADTIKRYRHGTPDDWIERKVYSHYTWQGLALMLGIDLILFGAAGLAVWAVQMIWIPFFAAGVINGIGHYWGYRNFECTDASTNISPWGILIGGEELHNNHHTYPTSAKLSYKWYEFDIGWLYIRILKALGLANVLRVAPVPKLAAPQKRIDLETVQAVITNRYDLLSRYAQGVRHTLREELDSLRLSASERARFYSLRRWLKKAHVQDSVPDKHQQTLAELLAKSGSVRTVLEMRSELAGMWERSSASREQMLALLQDWVARAEASGIRVLQDTALRIRQYRLSHVAVAHA